MFTRRNISVAAGALATALLCVASVGAAQNFEGIITIRVPARGQNSEPQLIELLSRGARGVRVNVGGQMGAVSMLSIPSEKKVYVLMDAQSMYMEMANPDVAATATDGATPKITRTGTKETIAGYVCEHVLIETPKETNDVCMAKGLGGFVNFVGGMGMARTVAPAWQKTLAADGAFPLKVANGVGLVSLEVTKIEKKKLSDALFTIPSNYTKMAGPGRRPS